MNNAEQRLAQVVPLYNAMAGMFPLLAAELLILRANYVESLVSENNDEVRGRIKQLDEMLRLPHSLSQEIQNLNESLPKMGDSE